ncbi:hypothetical protein VCHENC03_2278A, partial [Vibrio sp. HENC-03]
MRTTWKLGWETN